MEEPNPSTLALKEWAITVQALLTGETILLLRKGGIREEQRIFQLRSQPFLLFPTYEHQAPELLKPRVRPGLMPSSDRVEIVLQGWAVINQVVVLSGADSMAPLDPFHIWSKQFVQERLSWKPDRPLYGLLLRAYRLPQKILLPSHPDYGGCRSWIHLQEAISLEDSLPVLQDMAFNRQTQAILRALPPGVEVPLAAD